MSAVTQMVISEEALGHMEHLLAAHYIEGCVPLPMVALIEETLKGVGRWFPDPQYPYVEGIGYL